MSFRTWFVINKQDPYDFDLRNVVISGTRLRASESFDRKCVDKSSLARRQNSNLIPFKCMFASVDRGVLKLD
jgi:hypothetical protein